MDKTHLALPVGAGKSGRAVTYKGPRQWHEADRRLVYQRRVLDACETLLGRCSPLSQQPFDIVAVAKLHGVDEVDLHNKWSEL